MHFKQPPVLYNKQGHLRKVGFELEYTNLNIYESGRIIQELYGGKVEYESRFRLKVTDTALGDFTVEFDLSLLTEKRYKKVFEALNINIESIQIGKGTLEDEIDNALENLVGRVFPYEIATPPIPCTQLDQLEQLRESLFRHHAEGTASFLTNAFGTHINIEVPDTATATVIAYFRAFLLLYPWLLEVGEVDFARRVSPFIDPYPTAYIELVLSPEYVPNLDEFIQDYHVFNPDRNRPLDMYPLFAALRQDTLLHYKDIGKVKPREALHYRLPNSSIAQPDWTLAQEWNNWVYVEELANRPSEIAQLSQEYLALKNNTLIGFDTKWTNRMQQWVY